MGRVLLHAVGTMGDVHPMLALALELQRRGHTVRLATLGHFRDKIEREGVPFAKVGPDDDPEDPALLRQIFEQRGGLRNLIENVLFRHVRKGYDELAALSRESDVLVSGNNCYVPPLLHEKLGTPWISTTLCPFSFFSVHTPPVFPDAPALRHLYRLGPRFNRIVMAVARRSSAHWCREMHALRRDLGLPPVLNPLFDGHMSPQRVLAMFSQRVFPSSADWPAVTRVTGFVWYDKDTTNGQLPAEVEQFLAEGAPPIAFTLGSARVMIPGSFFEQSLAAARSIGARAILVAGRNDSLYRSLPRGRDWLVTRYVRYSQLFPRCAAVSHSVGTGTCAQVLAAGRPMLAVVEGQDSFDNGHRLQALGVARVIPFASYTARTAARELSRITRDPAYAVRAEEASRWLALEDGLRNAGDEVDAFLRARVETTVR